MTDGGIVAETVFRLGPLQITATVITTWVIMGGLWLAGWLLSCGYPWTSPRSFTNVDLVYG